MAKIKIDDHISGPAFNQLPAFHFVLIGLFFKTLLFMNLSCNFPSLITEAIPLSKD